MKNNCKIPKTYIRKINNFNAFFDEQNNDRIYQAINQIGNPIQKHLYEKDFFNKFFCLISTIFFLLKLIHYLYNK